ncbi:DeoR/GlpR family DNA-binding transcription regulator [Microlunatus flavus]|uniref:Lactose phosphotransferase system repressor n=1 Tax=Microlunatus flavus TaxID=1036181 RepID=A0A1H9MQ61_9ACTN|nr:DeoR/GlpR family DNA-binding transcription regulator [Microlunatus flavus]SER25565.1 DeoR family transcriptional regulator, glycerol-3-phosphate regulon repressor/DeoR family transcriptional regulator, fructose operon transcriptional repressor [Microlunatus flavus]
MPTRRAADGSVAAPGPDQRFERLLTWLSAEGRLDVGDAAERLGVAQETVRRDLRVLESRAQLVRVHGGAVEVEPALPGSVPGLTVPGTRAPGVEPEDRDLLEALWHQLPRNGTLLLGTGRLTLELATVMVNDPPDDDLTVVTNALDVALLLSRVSRVSVYNIGGAVSPRTHAQEGDWALTELHRLHTDVSVVCPGGLTLERGLSQPTPAAAAVSQAEVAAGSRVVALVEGAALGRPSFVTFAGLDEVDQVVVAGDPPPTLVEQLGEHGMTCTDRRSVSATRRGRKS